jgi:hypothetical protein
MNQPPIPSYLPAINYQLEYQAGLLSATVRPSANAAETGTKSRPWLGTDFTHIIVAR